MAKLRWDKVKDRVSDPARVIDVPAATTPERTTSVVERPTREELRRRSEQRDIDLMYSNAFRRVQKKQETGLELDGFDRRVLAEAAKRGF